MTRLTPMLLGLGVGAATVALVFAAGGEMVGIPIGLVVGLITSTRVGGGQATDDSLARRLKDLERTSVAESIGLEDELADLLLSASRTANRRLGHGKVTPFLVYETAAGGVAFREIQEPDPDRWLARAREHARALEDTRRVVIAVPWQAFIGKKTRPVILYEAAEQGETERTLSFIQGYRPGRLLCPGGMTTPVQYIGDGQHTLRFRTATGTTPA